MTEDIQNALEQAEAEGQPVHDIAEAAINGAEVQAEVNGPAIIITAEDGEETAENAEQEEAPQEYSMVSHYHVTGEQRKALVTAVSVFVDAPAVYQNAPTFAYAIGEYRVDKEGTLTGPASEALVAACLLYTSVFDHLCTVSAASMPGRDIKQAAVTDTDFAGEFLLGQNTLS